MTVDPDDEGGGGRGRTVVIMIVVALLVAGGVWLAQQMRASSRMQDCMMAGRTNCAPVQ